MKFRNLLIVGLAVLIGALLSTDAIGASKMWTATGNGIGTTSPATILPATAVATSSSVASSTWTSATLLIGGDMDSCKYTLQGSLDGSNWFDIIAETLINGTDETYALQVNHPIMWTGAAVTAPAATTTTNSWRSYPFPNHIRVKFQNHDAAGSDTAENVTIRIKYEY